MGKTLAGRAGLSLSLANLGLMLVLNSKQVLS